MDHMIKEKFIVTDGEKVTDEIYRVTGLDIEIDYREYFVRRVKYIFF